MMKAENSANKSLLYAYGLWFVGVITGVLGLHRFYAGRKRSGWAMLGMMIGAVLMLSAGVFGVIAPVMEQASAMLAGTPGAAGAFAPPTAADFFKTPLVRAGIALGGAAYAWMAVDLFLIPRICRAAKREF